MSSATPSEVALLRLPKTGMVVLVASFQQGGEIHFLIVELRVLKVIAALEGGAPQNSCRLHSQSA